MRKKYTLLFLLFTLINFSYAQDHISESCAKSKIKNHNKFINLRSTKNQDEFDINYYKIQLEIFPTSKSIDGAVDIYCKSLTDGLSELEFDFTTLLTIETVTLNGNILGFNHSSDLLKVFLPKNFSEGETIELSIKYSGKPGFSFHFDSKDGLPMLWTKTEPYGSMEWFPCKNLPNDKADSLDLIITVPSELIVASNGVLKNTVVNGDKSTYYWSERYPIASYLISLAIHPYKIRTDYFKYNEKDSMPVVNYILASQYENNQSKYAIVPEMLKGFTKYYGEYPFIKEKYGNAEFLWNGGMEHQTITSLLGPYEFLIAHELAHQWWGDMITCENFHHIWLNEGFATYSEALWDEYHMGVDAYKKTMQKKTYLGKGSVYVEDISNPFRIFDGNLSYKKASWVLHMLRHVVGDQTFFQILKAYGNSNKRYGVATTEDFEKICEQISGKNLGDFFDKWIYGDFHPVYIYDWTYKELLGSYNVTVSIEQFQVQNLFSMPIDIAIKTESGEENFVVQNFNKLQTYTLSVSSKPISVTLDKDNWILKEVKEGISSVNQDNNELLLTLSNDGSLGFEKPDGFGNGLIYPRNGNNILFFGSLMFGNNEEYVSDNSENNGHKDFIKKEGSKIEINNTTISNLDINVKYNDSANPTSKNISIDQTTYSWNLDPYREFIIFNYTLVNEGSSDLDDFYISQFLDFDIGDYLDNYIHKDEARHLIYQSNDGIYSGIRSLDNNANLKYIAISGAVDGLGENKKYQYLSGNSNDYKENKKADWSSLLSVGPYNFKSGDTLSINFAIVGGSSNANIKENSDLAQNIFEHFLTTTEDPVILNKNLINSARVSPNPIVDKINLEIFLINSQVINIEIYDVSGKKVYSNKRYFKSGDNSMKINKPLNDGLYIYRISTNSGVLTGKIIK